MLRKSCRFKSVKEQIEALESEYVLEKVRDGKMVVNENGIFDVAVPKPCLSEFPVFSSTRSDNHLEEDWIVVTESDFS